MGTEIGKKNTLDPRYLVVIIKTSSFDFTIDTTYIEQYAHSAVIMNWHQNCINLSIHYLSIVKEITFEIKEMAQGG